MRKSAVCLSALLVFALAGADGPQAQAQTPAKEAQLFFTSSTHGYFDPCG